MRHTVLLLGLLLVGGYDPARRVQVRNGFDEPVRVQFNGTDEGDYLEPGWETSIQTLGPSPDVTITVTFPKNPQKPSQTWDFRIGTRGVTQLKVPP